MLAGQSAKVRPGGASLTILALSSAAAVASQEALAATASEATCTPTCDLCGAGCARADLRRLGGTQLGRSAGEGKLPGVCPACQARSISELIAFIEAAGCPPAAAAAQGGSRGHSDHRRHIGPIARMMTDSRFVSARPQDRQRMAESAQAVMTCPGACGGSGPGRPGCAAQPSLPSAGHRPGLRGCR